MPKSPLLLFIACLFLNCQPSSKTAPADLILHNGTIYTLESPTTAEAIVVKKGLIEYVGSAEEAFTQQGDQTEIIDLQGKTLTPGLIESHGHFLGLGQSLQNLNLSKANSYADIVAMVQEAVEQTKPGDWILGRGWHQDKWEALPDAMVRGFPVHDAISAVSPDNPVFIRHASGHAGLANAKAMELAGITGETTFDETGEVIKDEQGQPTGLLNEEAETLVKRLISSSPEQQSEALDLAMQACLENGITAFHDAGVGAGTLEQFQALREAGNMKVRLYVMLDGKSETLLQEWFDKGPQVDDWLTVRSIKLYADGALGSRGALLLEPYEDDVHTHTGNPDMSPEAVQAIAESALQHGFQVCTHAIGDRANREVLNAYEAAFTAFPTEKDSRFRIEHAQHPHPEDIPRFGQLGVIASVQGIHMSSDRPWAIDRLGKKRITDGAYVWQKLLQSGAVVINGTDTPVEPINPIACFFASVTRQTLKGTPSGGYEGDQKMSRAEALRSYTIDAAYGAFQSEQKGSIAVGKMADFTVFTQDIMQVPDSSLLDTQVAMTIINGKIAYKKSM